MSKNNISFSIFLLLFSLISCVEKPQQASFQMPTLKKLKVPSSPDTIAQRLCNCGQKMLQIRALSYHSTSDFQQDSIEKAYQVAILDYNLCMENENIPALTSKYGRIDSAYMCVQREMVKICPELADTTWGGMETEDNAPVYRRRRWHHRRRHR